MRNEILKSKKCFKMFAIAMALLLAAAGAVPAHAGALACEQSVAVNTNTSGEEIGIKASWGEVVLTWNDRDYAYTTTKTYAGTAYYLYAQISGKDELGTIPPVSDSAFNDSSISSPKLESRSTSSSVTWTAYGKIQDTSTSNTQTATTSKTV